MKTLYPQTYYNFLLPILVKVGWKKPQLQNWFITLLNLFYFIFILIQHWLFYLSLSLLAPCKLEFLLWRKEYYLMKWFWKNKREREGVKRKVERKGMKEKSGRWEDARRIKEKGFESHVVFLDCHDILLIYRNYSY